MSSANVSFCVAREKLRSAAKPGPTILRRNGLPGKGVKDMRLECAWDFDQTVKVLFGGEQEEVR